MKNPNGYGSVYKLSGKRRRPWAARITIGYTLNHEKKTANPKYKFIGYYATRAEALRALALHNEEPDALASISLRELYDEWSAEHYAKLKETRHYEAAAAVLEPIWNKTLEELTIRNFEDVFRSSGKKRPTLQNTKIILKLSYAFAFRRGYISENKANLPSYISLEFAESGKHDDIHSAITKAEIEKLWAYSDDNKVQIIIFLIYTGLRISELANLQKDQVHLKEQYLEVMEAKTSSGIRKVPIADKILFIAESWMRSDRALFAPIGNRHTDLEKFRSRVIKPLTARICGKEHLPHDCRYACISRMTEEGVDDRYIKLIVGHKSQDVTNKIYAAKLDLKVLLDAVNKI